MITDIKEYYRKNADEFGWGPKTAHLNEERKKLLDKWVTGKKVLDIGCGTGIYVDYLTKKGFDAAGVDFVKEFIDYAKKHRKGKFMIADAYKLPFKDKSFDTVIMFDVLEHIENELKVINEIKRITKKRLIVIVPHKIDKNLFTLGLIYRHYIDKTHFRNYDYKELCDLFFKFSLKKIYFEGMDLINAENLINKILKIDNLIRKIIIKLLITLFKPKNYYSNIGIVSEVNDSKY